MTGADRFRVGAARRNRPPDAARPCRAGRGPGAAGRGKRRDAARSGATVAGRSDQPIGRRHRRPDRHRHRVAPSRHFHPPALDADAWPLCRPRLAHRLVRPGPGGDRRIFGAPEIDQFSLSLPIATTSASIGVSLVNSKTASGDRYRLASLSSTANVGRLSLFANAVADLSGDRNFALFVGASLPFGRRASLTTGRPYRTAAFRAMQRCRVRARMSQAPGAGRCASPMAASGRATPSSGTQPTSRSSRRPACMWAATSPAPCRRRAHRADRRRSLCRTASRPVLRGGRCGRERRAGLPREPAGRHHRRVGQAAGPRHRPVRAERDLDRSLLAARRCPHQLHPCRGGGLYPRPRLRHVRHRARDRHRTGGVRRWRRAVAAARLGHCTAGIAGGCRRL